MISYLRPALLTLMLSACASSTPPGVSPEVMARFTADMLAALHQQIGPYGTHGMVGAVDLKITLNRKNQPVACSATKGRLKHQLLLGTRIVTSSARLAQVVEAHCWLTRYPKVPEGLFDESGLVEIVAPLIYMPRQKPALL